MDRDVVGHARLDEVVRAGRDRRAVKAARHDARDDTVVLGLREEGEQIIADAGGKLVGVYVTLGRYDVVEIFEAPDDEVAIEILMKLNQYGAEHTETLRAFTRDEAEEIIRKL